MALIGGLSFGIMSLMGGNGMGGEFDLGVLRSDGGLVAGLLAAIVLLVLLANRLLMWVSIRGSAKREIALAQATERKAARAAEKANKRKG